MAKEGVDLLSVSKGIRTMFSLLSPNESSFEKLEEVPPYVEQVSEWVQVMQWGRWRNLRWTDDRDCDGIWCSERSKTSLSILENFVVTKKLCLELTESGSNRE